ncbi:hypothetical protein AO1008_09216 [Aspergillus oryzae 100-8]|uniref:Uncharacterized protein n=1 Tax=Aspergillus oryzae (strain 3.042) TaxID=1160506 RepID=I8II93_ASPO3|nr:hypothetical protein Ao3042_05337 [Aspergillus oryzae 3.042]KDE82781.1 hypothetical protein AO1008_09216 [Aspergillus oryzae 100-8]|eukprot:EIT78356.1 hypothetical protein Ao3042_05337 [Aspergillus oryzae 3.042]
MAAAIKAINAKIRSNKVLDYVCSTRKCNPKPCHGYRYLNYWNWGGREAKLAAEAAAKGSQAPEAGA